jgi:hypothetical protein
MAVAENLMLLLREHALDGLRDTQSLVLANKDYTKNFSKSPCIAIKTGGTYPGSRESAAKGPYQSG